MSESTENPKSIIDKLDLLSLISLGRKKKPQDKHYARFNRRMLAATIDSFFLLLFEPFFDWVAPINREALESIQVNPGDPNLGRHVMADIFTNHDFMSSWFFNLSLQMLVFCILSGVCWHYWSATPGKMLLRIKIVDFTSEQPITDRQIVIRLLGYWVSCFVFMMGILWIGIDKKKRGWHDHMAGTAVITLPWRKKDAAP